jgi:hypothetical protein
MCSYVQAGTCTTTAVSSCTRCTILIPQHTTNTPPPERMCAHTRTQGPPPPNTRVTITHICCTTHVAGRLCEASSCRNQATTQGRVHCVSTLLLLAQLLARLCCSTRLQTSRQALGSGIQAWSVARAHTQSIQGFRSIAMQRQHAGGNGSPSRPCGLGGRGAGFKQQHGTTDGPQGGSCLRVQWP